MISMRLIEILRINIEAGIAMINVPSVLALMILPIRLSAKPNSLRYKLNSSMNPEKPMPMKKVPIRNNRALRENKRKLPR